MGNNWPNIQVSPLAAIPASRHTVVMTDLCDFVDACRPPDDDLVDLIEQAFLEGQIDGVTAELAYLWVLADVER